MAVSGTPLPDPSLVPLAETIQGLFIDRGLSLADPATAEVYRTSLEAVRLLLAGAAGTGIITPDQRVQLRAMLASAEYAATPA